MRRTPTPEQQYADQLSRCDHIPFMHCVLSNRFECLCGKTSIPIGDTCPSTACLCGRPKAPAPVCDCIASGNAAKPKQHGADPHAKNCNVYTGRTT